MTPNHVVKISKKGFDVKTAKDDELLFNSNYPMLKIHSQGAGALTCTVDEPIASIEIPHDLGIIPMYFVLAEVVDINYEIQPNFVQLPYIAYLGLGFSIAQRVFPNEANLRIEFDLVESFIFGDTTLRYMYYIFEDPIIDVEVYG